MQELCSATYSPRRPSRALRGAEALPRRVAVHRVAFHPSRVTGESYLQVMAADRTRRRLDRVVEATDGEFAALCLIRPDDQSGTGLLEPVGVAPRHQRMGLGGAVRLGPSRPSRPAAMTPIPARCGSAGDSASCPRPAASRSARRTAQPKEVRPGVVHWQDESFRDRTFKDEDFRGARLRACRFDGCAFTGSRWSEAVLVGCSFSACRFAGADLNGITARSCSFLTCDFRGATAMLGGLLEECRMTGSTFAEASLPGLQIQGGDWSYASLKGLDLRHMTLAGMRLQEADLSGCNLERVDLRGADLRRALLAGATLRGADLRSADLDGVDLGHLDLHGVRLDLEGALQVARSLGAVLE